jgi:lipoate-protein ligase A
MSQPTPKQEMAAYDKLPEAVREVLANSGEQFSASQLLKLLRSGINSAELIRMMEYEQSQADDRMNDARYAARNVR